MILSCMADGREKLGTIITHISAYTQCIAYNSNTFYELVPLGSPGLILVRHRGSWISLEGQGNLHCYAMTLHFSEIYDIGLIVTLPSLTVAY